MLSLGHAHCDSCRKARDAECESCGISLTNLRCDPMKEFKFRASRFECRYIEEGCSQHLPWAELRAHEQLCKFRPYSCPLCLRWNGRDVAQHLMLDHHFDAIQFPYCTPLDWFIKMETKFRESLRWSILLKGPLESKDSKYFLVMAEKEAESEDLSIQIQNLNEECFIGALKLDLPGL